MRTVLIVDDSTVGRMLVSRVISDAGWNVVEADSGDAALRTIATSPPDIVLLDLLMPGLSGTDVLRAARAAGARMPIVILTADAQEGTRDECLALGATAVLRKPLTASDFAEVVATVEAATA